MVGEVLRQRRRLHLQPQRQASAGEQIALRRAARDEMVGAVPQRVKQREVAHDAVALHPVAAEYQPALGGHQSRRRPASMQ
jgi:hypothetical protein